MGAFKPLLPFGQKTVIESCIDNLRGGGVEEIVVVVSNDPRAEALRQHLQNSRVTVATNPDSNSEMSDSIACGVRGLSPAAKAILINPVDHAAVPAEVISQVIDEWLNGALLVKPTWNERGGHPVLIDLRFREELLSLDPNAGMKAFFEAHREQVKRLPVKANFIARDIDTWDDYRVLHQEIFGVPPPALPNQGR